MNKMTVLLDKIERRIGSKPLNLPEDVCKDVWAEQVIIPDTIATFSRYFPYATEIFVDATRKTADGYCLIDESLLGTGVDILGVKDIDWERYSLNSIRNQQSVGYGIQDFFSSNYDMDDIGIAQMGADHKSLFKNTIYLEFKEPNKLRFMSATGNSIIMKDSKVPVILLVKHPNNLMTISPTSMETFEDLAIADVSSFLYEYLKNFDGIETVYANIDMKLADLQDKSRKREEIIQLLKDSYINPSNTNQPMIITV